MPKLSLTDFVDVVSKSGTPKATAIRAVKNRPKYNPANDFYKKVRDKIVSLHEEGDSVDELDDVVKSAVPKRKSNYIDVVEGYKRWCGKKELSWFNPPSYLYEMNGFGVSVNPELGLMINGQPHVVKLYFKSEPLTKNRVEIITYMMYDCLKSLCEKGTAMCILDVRSSKLIDAPVQGKNLSAMINAELAYIAVMWDEL